MSETAFRKRLLGLDVGERRIGVAISDPELRFAVPLRSITRDGRGGEIEALASIVREDEVGEIVAGLPLSLSGASGPQAEATRAFAGRLETRLGLPVRLFDERLSTREALSRGRETSRGSRGKQRRPALDVDALAATIILQAYLDSRPWAQAGAP